MKGEGIRRDIIIVVDGDYSKLALNTQDFPTNTSDGKKTLPTFIIPTLHW